MANVCIIDNSQDVLSSLSERFAEKGFHTVLFNSIESASEKFTTLNADVLIINPFIDQGAGLEFLSKVTKNKNLTLPIIVMVGTPTKENLFEVMTIGVNCVLIKPFSFKVLAQKVEILLNPQINKQAVFDPAIIKIFLDAAVHVFEHVANIRVEASRPFLKSSNLGLNEVSAVIGLASPQVKGSMAVNLDVEILVRVLSHMVGHQTTREEVGQDEIRDVCGELANQILGRAKQQFLTERSMSFEITLPTVIYGKDHYMNYSSSSPVLVIPFTVDKKPSVFVEFCLEVNDNFKEKVPEEKLQVAVKEGELILF